MIFIDGTARGVDPTALQNAASPQAAKREPQSGCPFSGERTQKHDFPMEQPRGGRAKWILRNEANPRTKSVDRPDLKLLQNLAGGQNSNPQALERIGSRERECGCDSLPSENRRAAIHFWRNEPKNMGRAARK